MKIRIKGSSVRYRLTKSDVSNLCKEGYMEEVCSFGESSLTYALEKNNAAEISASFNDNKIIVYLPANMLNGWDNNDTVGFNHSMKINDGQYLQIIVEKDFKCNDETTEDQSDNYENPSKEC